MGGRRRRDRPWLALAGSVLATALVTSACGSDRAEVEPRLATEAGAPPPAPTSTTEPVLPVDGGARDGAADASGDASTPPKPPSPTDGVKNGTETDVDCGGPDAKTPRCAAYKACADDGDCTTGMCGVHKRCITAKSCTGAPGTFTCGPEAAQEDCCVSLPVPGGSYLRAQDPKFPATVSPFKLDKYEITVGRIRAYFEATGGSPRSMPPAPGAGAHPKIPNSGWRASFDTRLPGSWTEIHERLGAYGCTVGGDNSDGGAATWTAAPGPYEDLPITCLDWYTLFAFCAWDGGRLPTDAEWGFAAEGGDEKRYHAWGGPNVYLTWPETHAALLLTDPVDGQMKYTYGTPFRLTDAAGKVIDGPAHMAPPGRMPGYGRWGHADLTGNVLEYLLDRTPVLEGDCLDCARVDWPDPPAEQVGWYPPAWKLDPVSTDPSNFPDGFRSLRGGSWDLHPPETWYRYDYRIQRTYSAAGARCARD